TMSGRPRSSSARSPTAAAVHARTMSFWLRPSPPMSAAKRTWTGRLLLSKHSVRVCGHIRNDLQHVPMLDDLSVVVQPKNIDARPDVVAWPILPAVQNNVIAFGDHALELDALAGIVARGIFE